MGGEDWNLSPWAKVWFANALPLSYHPYDLWSQLRPLFKDKPFITVSIADKDTTEFKDARVDAKLFHRDHPPPGTEPLPLSPSNPAVLKLNGETIVNQFDEMNHRA